MLDTYRLYPQYRIQNDRRQHSLPVTVDRRSGTDRRSPDRVKLDTNLTRDIFVIKNSVATSGKSDNIQTNQTAKLLKNIPFTGKLLDSAVMAKNQEALNQTGKLNFSDTFLKSNNKIQPPKSSQTVTAGMLAGALAGIMSTLFLGTAGAIVGLGIGFYFGCKTIKNVIDSHLKK